MSVGRSAFLWVKSDTAFSLHMCIYSLSLSLNISPLPRSLSSSRVDGSWYEVMQLDFEVDNVINLVPTQTLHWQVEYRPPPAGGQSPPTTERATHLYIGNADIQGIVPLAEVGREGGTLHRGADAFPRGHSSTHTHTHTGFT